MPTTILVASSAWNLAGDWLRRPDFLRTHIVGSMAQGSGVGIGPSLPEHYRNSRVPGMRRFLKWSRNSSKFQWLIGVTNGRLPGEELDYDLVRNNIPLAPGHSVDQIVSAEVGRAAVSYWVRAYMNEHHNGLTFEWDYSPGTNTVTAVLDGSGTVVTFQPADYHEDDLYLYVEYVRDDLKVLWFIYREGTGIPALDSEFDKVTPEMLGTFYPPIPFMYENQVVAELHPQPNISAMYPVCKDAFRRAFGGDFDDVREKILENDSIWDIDFVYAVFAASFNTQENASRRYIYRFMQYLLNNTDNLSEAEESQWLQDWDADVSRPPVPWKSLEWSSIRAGAGNFRTVIRWAFMHENTGAGLLRAGAKSGDVWFTTTIRPLLNYPPDEGDGFNQRIIMNWQVTEDSWRRLTVIGLQYNNYVYRTDMSMTTAIEALTTGSSRESEFLVPLHEVIFESMPVVDRIQMSTSCAFLVFNCYVEDKEEWYESDWFRVIVVVVIIAVSVVAAVVTGGGSLGPSGAALSGFLGGAGLSAVASLIVAAAVEALAGILIAMLISEVAVTLFGEEWGPVIGAIVSFVFSFGMSAGSIDRAIDALTKPDTWMALASATGSAAANYMQAQAALVAQDTAKMLEEYGDKTAEVQRMYQDMVSGGTNGIDLSVVNRYIQETSERPADFFKRTLATGHDIAEVTLRQIEEFTRYNLQTVLP